MAEWEVTTYSSIWIECGDVLINLHNVSHITELADGGCTVCTIGGTNLVINNPGTYEQMRSLMKFPKERQVKKP